MLKHTRAGNSSSHIVCLFIGLILAVFFGVLISLIMANVSVSGLFLVAIGLLGLLLSFLYRNSVTFSLIFITAPFAILSWQEILQTQFQFGGMPINITDVLILTYCFVQCLAVLVGHRHRMRLAPPEWFALLCLTLLGIYLGIAYGNLPHNIIRNARAVLYLVMVFMATYSLVRIKTRAFKASRVIVIIGIIAGITVWRVGLMGVIRSVEFIWDPNVSMASVVNAITVTNTLYVAGYLVTLCHLLLSTRLTIQTKIIDITLLVFFISTMVFSGIRTTWIEVILTTLYIVVVSRRLKPGLVLAAPIGLLVGVFITIFLITTFTGREGQALLSERLNLERSFLTRVDDIHQAIIAVNNRGGWFFGNGLGATTEYSLPYLEENAVVGEWTGVHNAYIWYYLNLGIFGLICLFMIIGRLLRLTFIAIRLSHTNEYWLAVAANAQIIAIVIDALAAATFSIGIGSIVTTAIVWAVGLRLSESIISEKSSRVSV